MPFEFKEAALETAAIKKIVAIEKARLRIKEDGYIILSIEDQYVTIQCSKEHTFSITRLYLTDSKYKKTLCPGCYPRAIITSKAEEEIREYVSQFCNVEGGNRRIIAPLELDIVIPEKKLAIEYNGLYWHSEKWKDKNYHLNKTRKAEEAGYKLIHIFEDEWTDHPEIVKSRLRSYLGINDVTYARKCKVKILSPCEANSFLLANHIQGPGRANAHYGLELNGEIVAVMTFLKSDISKKLAGWELNRFASATGKNIVGGASRLLKAFVTDYSPETITTFADLRWSSGSTFYEAIGFNYVSASPPNYWYVFQNEVKRRHRYALRKPAGCIMTERELRESEGYTRIYDCGHAKYTWSPA